MQITPLTLLLITHLTFALHVLAATRIGDVLQLNSSDMPSFPTQSPTNSGLQRRDTPSASPTPLTGGPKLASEFQRWKVTLFGEDGFTEVVGGQEGVCYTLRQEVKLTKFMPMPEQVCRVYDVSGCANDQWLAKVPYNSADIWYPMSNDLSKTDFGALPAGPWKGIVSFRCKRPGELTGS